MGVIASNGGLIPWQAGISTSIGRLQFMLGREVGLSFYGTGKTEDILIVPRTDTSAYFLKYKSLKLDFPIAELRMVNTFSQNQSSGILLQLHGGVDIPSNVELLLPQNIPKPELKNYWYLGMRLLFNWRRYY